jgi:N utilization substance protein B
MSPSSPKARRAARRALLQALYQWQLASASAHEIETYFLAHQKMDKVDIAYFSELLKAIIREAEQLDVALAPVLDRKTTELTPVEHGILYIGCFELMHRVDVPYRVVINEGVELAKDFGAQDSYKYINGVLDKLSFKLRKAERLPD